MDNKFGLFMLLILTFLLFFFSAFSSMFYNHDKPKDEFDNEPRVKYYYKSIKTTRDLWENYAQKRNTYSFHNLIKKIHKTTDTIPIDGILAAIESRDERFQNIAFHYYPFKEIFHGNERKILESACLGGKLDILKKVLDYGYPFSKYISYRYLVENALKNDSAEILSFLINNGFDTSSNDNHWYPNTKLLHSAAYMNKPNCVRALLESGVNPNLLDHYFDTPLHYAIRQGNIEVLKVLYSNGADFNIRNLRFVTPITLIFDGGYINSFNKPNPLIIKYLVDNFQIDFSKQIIGTGEYQYTYIPILRDVPLETFKKLLQDKAIQQNLNDKEIYKRLLELVDDEKKAILRNYRKG